MLFALILGSQSGFAVVNMSNVPVNSLCQNPEVAALPADLAQMNLDQFLNLTPASYKKATGERLGFKKTIALKAAQKAVKKEMGTADSGGITKGLYIVLAIFGLAWIGMGVMDDWGGSTWIVNLLLTLLFWLPGFIHALVVMNKYYS